MDVWTSDKSSPDKVASFINTLNFTDGFKIQAAQEITKLFSNRFLFQAVAQTMQKIGAFYAGSGPHPSAADASAVIQAMKDLGDKP
jgi:hypothetical protein